ncbi:MAG: FKBP-type peptidyl-prolyl cis-trans isomerase [Saprospiraceae bacterium]
MRYSLFLFALCFIWACKTEKAKMTPSGYQYIHHVQTNGQKPQVGEEAVFTVDIRNDSMVVNSTRDQGKPARVLIPDGNQPARSISPIVEALMLMSVGDSLTVMQSVDSFPRKPPGFETSKFVNYDIVLESITSKEEIEKERAAQLAKMEASKLREAEVGEQTQGILTKYKANSLGNVKSTASGLKYYVIEEGTGKQVTNESMASVHYYGVTTDGNMFDNSFKAGRPYPVPVGQGRVIRGWDEGLQLLKGGTKAVLFIPGELGYGAAGSPPNIGPNAELVFYVEITEVN